MPNSSLRRLVIFIAGWVLAGLAVAVVAMRLWPQLVHRTPQGSTALENPPPVQSQAAASTRIRTATAADSLAETIGGSFASAVKASAPAVVSIYTRSVENVPATPLERLFGAQSRQLIQKKLGSGVIVDGDGHIITNYHVIGGSTAIAVQLADERTASARLVGSDPDTDLALLQVDLPRLPVMKLGRSDRVEVGDIVLAIGNPFGYLAQTVTHGIVSATGRADLGVALYEDFIQTDAAINDGNSGGALVNTHGELIGINTAVLGKEKGAEGLGIAIPVDLVRGVIREILQHGRVIRGWIGIAVADVSPGTARLNNLPHAGVAINVNGGSPAAAAGLQLLDMVRSIDGQEVTTAQDVRARIASHKPGSTVRIAVDRGSNTLQFEVPVREAPPQPQ
jgi:serine protease DegS